MTANIIFTETAQTQYVNAANGITFAYRRVGKTGGVPLVCHIHFRGNMDFWDPLLINTIAVEREVILFDNAGVGKSTGQVPVTFAGWANDMNAFIRALNLTQVDLLGFSMGGLAVTYLALDHPELVRKLIIAGSKASIPTAASVPGIVWPPEGVEAKYFERMAGAVTTEESGGAIAYGLFPLTKSGERAFQGYWDRLKTRRTESPTLELIPMNSAGSNQIQAVIDSETPNVKGSFDRLHELKIPVLVANGDSDVLIASSRSWELLKQIENAQLIIYPRSGHGFLWQYAKRFGDDINRFLHGDDFED